MDNDELLVALQDMFEKKVEEVNRHTGVLVEGLRGDIKTVAEGHSILDRKIDNLQKELSEKLENTRLELKEEIHGLKKDMDIVKDYVIGVDAKLNEHEIIIKRVK